MDLGLRGRVATVAGASRGLGFAVARALAAEGVRLSIASRHATSASVSARRIEEESGSPALGVTADLRVREAIKEWYRATVERFGTVDFLVTNSGGPPARTLDSFDDAWRSAFELLVLSAIRMVRVVLPSMLARKGGSIVMLTSSSVKHPIANLALSNVLRPAVAALAKTLALEVARQGVRVNHVIPGRIATDRGRELDEVASQRLGISLEEQQSHSIANVPLGRVRAPRGTRACGGLPPFRRCGLHFRSKASSRWRVDSERLVKRRKRRCDSWLRASIG